MASTLLSKLTVLVTFSILLVTSTMFTVLASDLRDYPVALSKTEDGVYALYSDGVIKNLVNNKIVCRVMLPDNINLSNYVVDFYVGSSYVYLNLYKSINNTSGINYVFVYSVGRSEKPLINRKYSFAITSKGFRGKLIVSSIPYRNGLGLVVVDSVRGPRIKVYDLSNGASRELEYNSSITMLVYVYNDSLVAAIPSRIRYGNSSLYAGIVVDLVKNKTLYTIPAIAPIIKLAKLVVQPFMVRNEWNIYVTVIGGLLNYTEFYLVKPNDIKLKEYHKVVVDPFMRFAIISIENENKTMILFSDGTSINISVPLSIVPQNYYFYNEPLSGVLDVDVGNHLVLYRVVEDNKTELFLASPSKVAKVYSTSIDSGLKVHGFYAYIYNNKLYVLMPSKHSIEIIDIGSNKEGNIGNLYILLLVMLVLIIVTSILSRMVSRKLFAK